MKKSILVGMIIAVVCLGFIALLKAGEPSPQLKATSQKWEYKEVNFGLPPHDISRQDKLNKEGKDGWELVSVQSDEVNGTTGGWGYAYFKRPLAQ